MPLLRITGLVKRFNGVAALDGIDCTVSGRCVGLLGPNGAGKTTLMRVCLGLLRPDAGAIEVLGVDVIRHPLQARRRLGFAAEGAGRMPGLSGLESVALAGELCGMRRREALLRAHDMLDLVGLDEARYRDVAGYSTGMLQRVKVAMALVHDPDLVLFDEPTSGLDPKSRESLLDLICHLRDGDGPAVILSSHLLHDVERACDTCVIMDQGKVRFCGPLEDLRAEAKRRFTGRLLHPCPELFARFENAGLRLDIDPRRAGQFEVELTADTDIGWLWAQIADTQAALVEFKPAQSSLEAAFLAAIGKTS